MTHLRIARHKVVSRDKVPIRNVMKTRSCQNSLSSLFVSISSCVRSSARWELLPTGWTILLRKCLWLRGENAIRSTQAETEEDGIGELIVLGEALVDQEVRSIYQFGRP